MIQLFKNILIQWNSQKNQRIKLQQAYFMLVLILAVTAGLVTLLRVELGRLLLMGAAFAASVYVINATCWALIDGILVKKIDALTKVQLSTSKKR